MPPKAAAPTAEPSAAEYDDDFEAEEADEETEVEEKEPADDEEAEEDDGDEEEEESEEEEETDEEDEDNEDDDESDDESSNDSLVDPLSLKISKDGSTKCTVLRLSNDIKFTAFLRAIATHLGFASYRDLLVYYVPDDANQRCPISSPKQFTAATDFFWSGKSNYLRLFVANGKLDASTRRSLKGMMPVAAEVPPVRALSSEGSMLSSSLRCDGDDIRRQIEASQEGFRWTVMRNLGSGAYGQVFEALTDSGRLLAVKHLVFPSDAPACVASTSEAAEELVSEIRLLKRLRHRHIVEYYGCQTAVQENGSRVIDIFLEHCHGGSINALRHRFDKAHSRLTVVLVRHYVRQVLRGLEYLHRKGVVHRDIKGDNVLIGGNGEAKLADFGCSKQVSTSLAKTADLSAVAATPVGVACRTMVGTPLFMAPEVLKESSEGYTSSADVWSVGCLVIELFGRKPWIVQGSTLFAVMYAVATSTTLPTGMPDSCDEKMKDFLIACFERDSAKRPSCTQLLESRWMTCPDAELSEPQWKEE